MNPIVVALLNRAATGKELKAIAIAQISVNNA
jgi:hypothetical protein